MARQVLYVQCILRNGKSLQTSWIPEKYAIVGQYLKTNDDIGYVVLDVDKKLSAQALELLKKVKETIKVRMLY